MVDFGGHIHAHMIYIYICSTSRQAPPTYGIPSYATTHYIMGVDKSGNCLVLPYVDSVLV